MYVRVQNTPSVTTVHLLASAVFWIDTSMSGLQDSGCTNSVQSKRLHVLNVWREVQQLEEEINTMVSTDTTTATERCIKDIKVPHIAYYNNLDELYSLILK